MIFFSAFLLPTLAQSQTDVVITEIMYQPAGAEETLEFVEILNPTGAAIDLTGYSFTDGITFDFPAGTTLAAGEYLVVVKDAQAFASAYPAVANFLGDFAGQLRNSGENLALSKLDGGSLVIVDSVDYNDGGKWPGEADGSGASLELIHPNLNNNIPEAWAAGLTPTPGAVNGNHQANPPPIVWDVLHSPAVPQANESITVTAKVNTTTGLSNLTVTLHHRQDAASPGAYQSTEMFDDGAHGDGFAGDGIFGVALSGQDNDTVKAFQIQIDDTAASTSTRVPSTDPGTAFLCLFQDNPNGGCGYPTYHILMTRANRLELETRSTRSNVLLDGTLITSGGSVFYNCELRYRGNGSRNLLNPPNMNYRISLPPGEKIAGQRDLNFNGSFPILQWIGMDAFRRTGDAANDTEFCSVTLNETLLVPNQGEFYIRVEAFNKNYAANHWPDSDDGNIYRGVGGRFGYIDNNVNSYKPLYQKETNQDEDEWQDIVDATIRFDNTTAPDYVEQLNTDGGINIDQWVNHLAMHAALANDENGFYNGRGDDYAFYHHPASDRMLLLPWDMDSVIDVPNVFESLFQGGARPVNRFRNHPEIRPRYLRRVLEHLDRLLDDASMTERFDAIDCAITQSYRSTLLNLIETRRNFVTATHGGEPLVPVSPTGLSVILESSGMARLNWTDESSDETSFSIERSADGFSWAEAGSASPNAATFLDPGLGPDVETHYRVRAVNATGPSYPSNQESIVPGTPMTVGPVVINEILAHTDLPELDSVELHNSSNQAIDISHWWLTDDLGEHRKYQFPANTTLPAMGFVLVDESDFNGTPLNPDGFLLSSLGDEIWLLSAGANGDLTGQLHGFDFGASENGVTLGRVVNSDGKERLVRQAENTLSLSNSAVATGPVIISEIMFHPPDLDGANNTRDEFIEIRNLNDSPVLLYDPDHQSNAWKITNGIDFEFPPLASIPARGHILIVGFDPVTDAASLAEFQSTYGLSGSEIILGPFEGKLDNGEERITLRRPDDPQQPPAENPGFVPMIEVDSVRYGDGPSWPAGANGTGLSLQRLSGMSYADEPLNWAASSPTPSSAPPPGPGDLSGTDGFYDDKVRLSWSGIGGALEYVIYRNESPSSEGAVEIARVTAGTDDFEDVTAAAGIRFYYTIAAVMPGNEESALGNWAAGKRSAEVTYRPDGLIGKWSRKRKGNGVYNKTGARQTVTKRSRRRKKVRFSLLLQNDGVNPDELTVRATRGNRIFRAKYFQKTAGGGRNNVTAPVVTGFHQVPLAGGAQVAIDLETKRKGRRTGRMKKKTFRFTGSSRQAPGRSDTVKAKAKSP